MWILVSRVAINCIISRHNNNIWVSLWGNVLYLFVHVTVKLKTKMNQSRVEGYIIKKVPLLVDDEFMVITLSVTYQLYYNR